MREALAGLTIRGRAFLAAGVTAVVSALVLGQSALTRVGILMVVLPLIACAVVGRARYRLALSRTVTPSLVVAGQPARVTLSITNEGRTPAGVLLLEDQVPYVLGTRPRFVLDGMRHGWRRSVSYQVRSDVRGRFEIGPMSVRVGDPFGLVEMGRAFRSTSPLVVTPRTVPLPTIPLSGGYTGSGDNRPRAFATGSAEDVTVREYRRGDDLRRVHWRSSARTGELMVRREEQPWQSRATLLLDDRASAHRGEGVAGSFETAVAVTASIALHLVQRGFSVRLVTSGGEHGLWHDRDPGASSAPLLEALAVLRTVPHARLDAGWVGESGHDGLTVGVFGALDETDHPALRRIRHHAANALAVSLEVEAWRTAPGPAPANGASNAAVGGSVGGSGGGAGDPGPGAATATGTDAEASLLGTGWRTAGLHPRDRLEECWRRLGRTSTTRPSAGRAPATPTAEEADWADSSATDLPGRQPAGPAGPAGPADSAVLGGRR